MTEHSIVGIYPTKERAEKAVQTLKHKGFPVTQVSVVAKDVEHQVQSFIQRGEDITTKSAVTGAWMGGALSLLMGTVLLWVPGFGPLFIAGRLAALLVAGVEGALAGAATGGLLGALVNWGVAEEHLQDYKNALQAGHYLVIAHGDKAQIKHAHAVLNAPHGEALRLSTSVDVSTRNRAGGKAHAHHRQ